MKKTLFLAAASLMIVKASFAQVDKSVRFGIRATPAVNWMTPDNDKKVKKGGAVMKAGMGLVLEFKLSDVATFQTGADYTGAGFKAEYTGTDTAGYLYKDDAIVEAEIKNDSINGITAFMTGGGASHRLATRKYNLGYLNIPLTFKLKTKDIGGITYFGQIGGNIMFRMKARANDEVYVTKYTSGSYVTATSTTEIEKIDIAKTMNLMTAAANVGGGLEYNISGSTSLYGSIHYQHHFMFATKQDSGYLIRSKTENNKSIQSEFPNGVRLRQFVLAVGILF
ncbi:MAG: outer membrane beta-barrel protein [Bacteroidota bacterium]|nr:outer membrane beta-barrel protein [Bacteroidota bacterium]